MENENEDIHQEIMNRAYEKWKDKKNWTYDDFIDNLPLIEAEAVILGNFNYQVCNGGFSQYDDNGYSSQIERLKRILKKINTEISNKVLNLVIRFEKEQQGKEDYEDFGLDSKYYEINEEFMKECEVYLSTSLNK